MLLKCGTPYASKFGKLSSGHRTAKRQFSFQSQKMAMPKNIRMTRQLCSFHMLARLCTESFKLGFGSMWIVNLKFTEERAGFRKDRGTRDQIANVCWIIEKAREFKEKKNKTPPINQQNTISASLTTLNSFILWITTNCGKFLKRWGYKTILPLLRNLYWDQEATIRTGHETRDWFKIGKGVHHGYILVPCLFNLYVECTLKNVRLDDSQTGIKISGKTPTT